MARRLKQLVYVLSTLTAVLASFGPVSVSRADHPPGELFTIVAGFDDAFPREEIRKARDLQETLTATVDGQECGTVDLRNNEDQLFVLGVEGQPEPCHRAGAEIVLYNAFGNEMNERFIIQHGETVYYYNYAVAPVNAGPGLSPAPADTGMLGPADTGSPISISYLGLLTVAGALLIAIVARTLRSRSR